MAEPILCSCGKPIDEEYGSCWKCYVFATFGEVDGIASYEPSQAQIRAACKKIQKTWNRRERESRKVVKNGIPFPHETKAPKI